MNNEEKCNLFINKWLICYYFNNRLPPYEKPNDCDEHYKKYLKECTDEGEKYKIDKIFKASIFATH